MKLDVRLFKIHRIRRMHSISKLEEEVKNKTSKPFHQSPISDENSLFDVSFGISIIHATRRGPNYSAGPRPHPLKIEAF